MMRAVVYDQHGGPEVLRVGDVPEPHAGPGQVRIAVRTAALNPLDTKQRRGFPGAGQPESAVIPGVDAAGVVDEVGEGVTGIAIGDEVIGLGQGVQAERAVLRAWTAKPGTMSWEEAGAIGLVGETAARGLRMLALTEGQTLLVDGASGGVGKIAVQLAIARGARVIGSASPGSQELVAALGAAPVLYGEGLADRVRALAQGGVDKVFDTAGKTPIGDLVALVPTARDVVTIANFGAGGAGVQVSGGEGADPFACLTEVADLYRAGALSVTVDQVLPLEQVARGHEAVEAGTTKVVLTLDSA